jgi:hypothetical protein
MAIVRQLASATNITLLSSGTSFTLLPGDRAPSRTGSVRVTDAFRFLFPWTQQSTAKYRKRFTSEKPVLDLVFTVGGIYCTERRKTILPSSWFCQRNKFIKKQNYCSS